MMPGHDLGCGRASDWYRSVPYGVESVHHSLSADKQMMRGTICWFYDFGRRFINVWSPLLERTVPRTG